MPGNSEISKDKKGVALGNQLDKSKLNRYLVCLTLTAVILFTATIRFRLREIPLERDEGVYAYGAQLILEGQPEYPLSQAPHMGGLYCFYALILLAFGQTCGGIHLGLLVVNLASVLMIFFLGRRLFDSIAGIGAAACYGILTLSDSVLGFSTNAEPLLLLPALAGILLLLRAIDSGKIIIFFAAGLLLGLSIVIKVHGIFFIGFGGFYLFVCYFKSPLNKWRRYLLEYISFGLGVIVPFGILCLYLWHTDLLDDFRLKFEYSKIYASKISLSDGLNILRNMYDRIVPPAFIFWIIAVIGLTAFIWNRKIRKQSLFILTFLVFSFLSICPGLHFRPHYFILLLPAVALLFGIAISSTTQLFSKVSSLTFKNIVPILMILIATCQSVYNQREYLFVLSPQQACQWTYSGNPFVESVEIADYIRQRTSENDTIAVLGSEPQIFFYARRHSASKYLFVHKLMWEHEYASQVQKEMIKEIETAQPEFIVFVKIPMSWVTHENSDMTIFDWFQNYGEQHYNIVGMIDIVNWNRTIYRWGSEADGYMPKSRFWVGVFQRKND